MGGDGLATTTSNVNVHIRCSNGSKFSMLISLDSNVGSFKSVLAQNCDILAEQQCLIHKCRILKDDQTLKVTEATRALNEMNGKMIGRKPLYVALAQCKEEKKVLLQAHFFHPRALGGMAPLPTTIPGFHPEAPRLAPQLMYFGDA